MRPPEDPILRFLLDRERRPLAVLDARGRLLCANQALGQLVATKPSSLVGKVWDDALEAVPRALDLVREAKKASCSMEIVVRPPRGRRLFLSTELQSVRLPGGAGVAIVVGSWTVTDTDQADTEGVAYDISAQDFGIITWARTVVGSVRGVGQRCHMAYHGRNAPCAGCPALEVLKSDSSESTNVVHGPGDGLSVATARRVDANTIRVRVSHVDRALLAKLVRARADALAAQVRLTVREREVLDLLLLGRSSLEVSRALEISPSTAKFHQANVLKKLGAESRHDLVRLFV